MAFSSTAIGEGCDVTPAISRPFLMGFTTLPPSLTEAGWATTYTMLQYFADLIGQNLQDGVPWSEALASEDYQSYPQPLKTQWWFYRETNRTNLPHHALYLMLNPIALDYRSLAPNWGGVPLTSPWNTYSFNSPNVKTAFLNYVIAAITYFQPQYVSLGVEANILLARAPEKWMAYKELNAYVYTAVKTRFPKVKLFPTIQYEYLLGRHSMGVHNGDPTAESTANDQHAQIRNLLRHADLIALSTYPYMVYLNEVTPNYYDPVWSLSLDLHKPVAIEQTGYTTQDVHIPAPFNVDISGNQELQSDFVGSLLNLACAHNLEFVINFVPADYGDNYSVDSSALAWAYTGLLDKDGLAKPALEIWRAFFLLTHRSSQ
jgi:hypothetical protein